MVLAVVANEEGNAVLVMVSMDGHFNIVRLALLDGACRRVEWEAGSSAGGGKGYKGYLRCNLW